MGATYSQQEEGSGTAYVTTLAESNSVTVIDWEEDIVDGGVFFDFSPALFSTILQFLRLRRLCGDILDIGAPPVPYNQVSSFDRLLDYLSMKEYVPINVLDSTLLIHDHTVTLGAWLAQSGSPDLT